MKQLKFLTFGLLSMLFLMLPVFIFAQEIGDPTLPENATSLGDYVASFAVYCATCIAAAAFVITAFATKFTLKGWVKYIIAFVVSFAIGIVAYVLKLGIFAVTIGQVLVYILGGFLMAAGLFKFPIVEGLLGLVKLVPKKADSK